MSNGVDSTRVLQAECAAAIDDIKRAAPAKSCAAHEPLARGVIVLLRGERRRLERSAMIDRYMFWGMGMITLCAVGIAMGKGPLIAKFVKWVIS